MPLDEKPSEAEPEIAVQGDEWDGPWGSISAVVQSIDTLCIQIEREAGKPRIYYYPYRTIGKWNWRMGFPETLEIQVGSVQVTITGSGLRRLADAMNLGQLRLVQLNQSSTLTAEICIRAISIDDLTR
jgi:hypothetical protein